jgi:hypothetical protein
MAPIKQLVIHLSWLTILCAPNRGMDLETLRKQDGLTPEKFAEYFRKFKFELNEKPQQPDLFLARETGDCDDYATLAATILGEKGYHTRLIVVFMPRVIHVVCFISERGGYLDYNERQSESKLLFTSTTVEAIANRVATSFSAKWYCAAEFTYKDGTRVFSNTEFPCGDGSP